MALSALAAVPRIRGPLARRCRSRAAAPFRSLHWALAVAATALAYAALAWYDQIALLHLGRRLSWRFVGLVSFTTYALAHNIGATVLSGAVVRYRAYSTKGLGAAEIGVLVAFCSFTFTLGNLLLGGIVAAGRARTSLRRSASGREWAGVRSPAALLLVPWLYTRGRAAALPPAEAGRL